ncbi:hypothetical protein ABEB36_000217 [Hypothenemus hampei]|uniref:THAP-type domain-containing protein n=1 Tax=Hypothenemus hampei TaxID=57062 RepID=A0ABD1E646_HYPHA
MVLSCALCGKDKRQFKNYSFFMVPKEPDMRKKWQEFAKWTNVLDHYRLCEDHFSVEQIYKRYPRPLLKKNAVPQYVNVLLII